MALSKSVFSQGLSRLKAKSPAAGTKFPKASVTAKSISRSCSKSPCATLPVEKD
jgi:hypothetical protein